MPQGKVQGVPKAAGAASGIVRRVGGAPALLAVGLLLAGCVSDGSRAAPTVGAAIRSDDSSGVVASPETLLGAPAERVLAALGQPELQRRELPAEVWQYHGRGCVLDVFLYASAEAGGGLKQVAHLEARDSRAQSISVDRCLNGVQRRVATRYAS